MAGSVLAQADPFGALYAPPPGKAGSGSPLSGNPLSSNPARTGATSVTGAVGRSYAGSQTGGTMSLAQIAFLPKNLPPMAVKLEGNGQRYLKNRPRIAIPTFGLGFVQVGQASASAAGAGSELAQRRTSIATRLVGFEDDRAAGLAEEAYKDLVSRLTAAGFEVVPADQVAAAPHIQSLGRAESPLGGKGLQGGGGTGWIVYAPAGAPLIKGYAMEQGLATMAASGALLNLGHASKELDAVIIVPRLMIDHLQIGGSGRSLYTGSAQVGAELKFGIGQSSRTDFIWGNERGGAMPGSFTTKGLRTEEPFGIMVQTDDRSDSKSLHNALATAGFGSLYRQSLVYEVEVEPARFAALSRAAIQGYNTALVEEIRRARSN